jgi:hypothetical protein
VEADEHDEQNSGHGRQQPSSSSRSHLYLFHLLHPLTTLIA